MTDYTEGRWHKDAYRIMPGRRHAYEALAAEVLGWQYIPPGAAAHGRAADHFTVDEAPVLEWPSLGRRARAIGAMREHITAVHGPNHPLMPSWDGYSRGPLIIDDPVRPGPASPRLADLAAELLDKAHAAQQIGQLHAMWGPDEGDRLGDYSHALAVRDPAPAPPPPGLVWWPRQHDGRAAAVAPVWPHLGAHMRRHPAAGIAAALATWPGA